MRILHSALVPALVGTLVSCGGSATGSSSPDSGSVSGTVAGTAFTLASEVATFGPASANSTSCGVAYFSDGGQVSSDAGCVPTTTSRGQVVAILLTNRAALTCAALQSAGSRDYANFDLLTLEAFTETGTLATGVYDIVTASNAASGSLAQFETSTSACGQGVNLSAATSGSITLTVVGSANVAGTYTVTFGMEGTFTGSFDVAICDLPNGTGTAGADAGPPVCLP